MTESDAEKVLDLTICARDKIALVLSYIGTTVDNYIPSVLHDALRALEAAKHLLTTHK